MNGVRKSLESTGILSTKSWVVGHSFRIAASTCDEEDLRNPVVPETVPNTLVSAVAGRRADFVSP
jgi:hypothetical protein